MHRDALCLNFLQSSPLILIRQKSILYLLFFTRCTLVVVVGDAVACPVPVCVCGSSHRAVPSLDTGQSPHIKLHRTHSHRSVADSRTDPALAATHMHKHALFSNAKVHRRPEVQTCLLFSIHKYAGPNERAVQTTAQSNEDLLSIGSRVGPVKTTTAAVDIGRWCSLLLFILPPDAPRPMMLPSMVQFSLYCINICMHSYSPCTWWWRFLCVRVCERDSNVERVDLDRDDRKFLVHTTSAT